MTTQRMTPQEFEDQENKLVNFSAKINRLARLVLVDGLTHTKAAKAVGMSPQNVNGAMNRVKAAMHDVPADYVFIQEWMPANMAAELRTRLKALKDKAKAFPAPDSDK